MSEEVWGEDWKVRLRYGRLSTPFQHFAMVADGVAGELIDGFDCGPGPAVVSMKGWAADGEEAVDMLRHVCAQIGFSASGRVEVFHAELDQPPRDHPYAYNISFVPYSENGGTDE